MMVQNKKYFLIGAFAAGVLSGALLVRIAPDAERNAAEESADAPQDDERGDAGAAESPAEAGSTVEMLVVKEDTAVLRAGHGPKFARAGQLFKGDLIYPVDNFQGWFRVRLPSGAYAWISERVVRSSKVPARRVEEYKTYWPQPQPFAVPSMDRNWVEVVSDELNIRSYYSSTYAQIDRAYKGDALELLAFINNWYKVKLPGGTSGWAVAKYVKPHILPHDLPADAVSVRGRKISLNSGPGARIGGIAELSHGERLTVLNALDGWYQVRTGKGLIGWVSAGEVAVSTSQPEDGSSGE